MTVRRSGALERRGEPSAGGRRAPRPAAGGPSLRVLEPRRASRSGSFAPARGQQGRCGSRMREVAAVLGRCRGPAAYVSVAGSVTVPGTLRVGVAVPRTAREGEVSGLITLGRAGNSVRMPFWYRVERPRLPFAPHVTLRRTGIYRGTRRAVAGPHVVPLPRHSAGNAFLPYAASGSRARLPLPGTATCRELRRRRPHARRRRRGRAANRSRQRREPARRRYCASLRRESLPQSDGQHRLVAAPFPRPGRTTSSSTRPRRHVGALSSSGSGQGDRPRRP